MAAEAPKASAPHFRQEEDISGRKGPKPCTLPGELAIVKEALAMVSGCISIAAFHFSREAKNSYFVSLVAFPPQQYKDSEGK